MTRVWTGLALLGLVAATIGCDRVTKQLAVTNLAGAAPLSFLADTVRLQYSENPGAFLSLGANLPQAARTAIFTIGNACLLIAAVTIAIRVRVTGWQLIGTCLFVAGGLSNLIDRLHTGHVVDFLNLGVGWLRTGIFNVADVAILLGGAQVLLAEIVAPRPPSPPAATPRDEPPAADVH